MGNKNFLIGYGERLAQPVEPATGGNEKKLPYSLEEAYNRLSPMLIDTTNAIDNLPSKACPDDVAVGVVTLHPQFLAKSFFPSGIFSELELKPIGSRAVKIKPEKWTRNGDSEVMLSSEVFIAGKRSTFKNWLDCLLNEKLGPKGQKEISRIEQIKPFNFSEKIRFSKEMRQMVYEIVLHSPKGFENLPKYFSDYLRDFELSFDEDRILRVGGLSFLPLRASPEIIKEVAKFSFLRVARPMPALRPLKPGRTTNLSGFDYKLPQNINPVDPTLKVAIFDGGIVKSPELSNCVSVIEPEDIGQSEEEYLSHGMNVTSALLFGPMREGEDLERPFAKVDHYRVLDSDCANDPYELHDVIKRIQKVLKSKDYNFFNLSIGPDLPIDDNEVHAWTAALDDILADGDILGTVAIGNNGDSDASSGNNRIQTPSDSVNALAVGATNSMSSNWKRASYSAFGPGRSPGVIKPDVVTFGGSYNEPFYALGNLKDKIAVATQGTSFAAPSCLRQALGVKAYFGDPLSPLALKTLLIHSATPSNTIAKSEIGWGCVPLSIDEIMTCDNGMARILYQGEIEAGQFIRIPIPLPSEEISGKVELTATFCFSSKTDPEDPGAYTRNGLDVVFRPHSEKFSWDEKENKYSKHPSTDEFFQLKDYSSEVELRRDAHKWETALHRTKIKYGRSLKEPVFDIHYNERVSGQPTNNSNKMRYALVISVRTAKMKDIYNKILQRYPTILVPLRPKVQIPVEV